tara:strand:+ start:989 stop:1285 length:297 start_codon:yes stop_codon:yes gene_type:complete
MKPYILNRVGRALVAGGITYTATEQINILPVAVTEIMSVTYEINYILPYFGNIIWLVILSPIIPDVYNDVFFFENKTKQLQERIYLFLFFIFLSIYNL